MNRNPIIQEDLHRIAAADLPWQELAGRTVLVSGAGGFLPAFMIHTLAFINENSPWAPTRIIGMARDVGKAKVRLGTLIGRDDFQLLVQDVCEEVADDVVADYVIHAASQASPKFYGKDPVGTLRANTLGTEYMLDLAHRSRSRAMLFFSSSEIYGPGSTADKPLTESSLGPVDPAAVRSCYAEGKRAGETMCVCWHHQYGMPTKIVRPFHTYGPGMSVDDGRVFADFVADAVAGRDIVLHSDGSARRAFCYLADAVEGFFTVLLKGLPGQAYNVGNPAGESSILDLAKLIVGLVPEKKLNVRIDAASIRPGYIPSKVARNLPDISKLAALGWWPHTPIEEGFRRTLKSFGE